MPIIVTSTAGPGDFQLSIDDPAGSPVYLHPTANRYLTKATGLTTISSPRAVVRAKPQAHGAIDDTHYTSERLIALEGFVQGADEAAAITELRAVQAAILQTLDTGPALLKWTEAGSAGLTLQASVKLASDLDTVYEAGPALFRYQVQLRAADPRAYSQTLTTATGVTLGTPAGGDIYPDVYPTTYTPSTGGTLAVNNTGNRPTPPVFRLYGGVTDADIILVGTTKQISLSGNVANGDYLEIDVQARTIRLNGTSNALYYLDAPNTTWFELPVGTSTIRTTGLSFDATARCDVLYRAAYT